VPLFGYHSIEGFCGLKTLLEARKLMLLVMQVTVSYVPATRLTIKTSYRTAAC
jgi:hypothetical protein